MGLWLVCSGVVIAALAGWIYSLMLDNSALRKTQSQRGEYLAVMRIRNDRLVNGPYLKIELPHSSFHGGEQVQVIIREIST